MAECRHSLATLLQPALEVVFQPMISILGKDIPATRLLFSKRVLNQPIFISCNLFKPVACSLLILPHLLPL